MSAIIGTIAAGPDVTTTFTVQNLPQILFIDSVNSAPNITGLEVEVDGQTIWSLRNQTANVMYAIGSTGAPVAGVGAGACAFVISNGYLENVPCVIRVTNQDAGTQTLYGISLDNVSLDEIVPTEAKTEIVLQDQSKQMFGEAFDMIVFDRTNFEKCDLVLSTGYTISNLDAAALTAYLMLQGANLGSVQVSQGIIDNSTGWLSSVTFYAQTGNLNLAVINL